MAIFEFMFFGFVIYSLYKFVFNFVLPIYNTTKRVKQQFGNMKQTMQDQFGGNTNFNTNNQKTETTPPKSKADYIEFEEVK